MPAGIRVSVDLKEFAGRFSPAEVGRVLSAEMKRGTLLLARNLAMASPTHWSSMSKGWLPSMVEAGARIIGAVVSASRYLAYPILGFRPHFIPVGAKGFLAWRHGMGPPSAARYSGGTTARRGIPAVKGQWIYTRKGVHHPGWRGYDFAKVAVAVTARDMANSVADRVAAMLVK